MAKAGRLRKELFFCGFPKSLSDFYFIEIFPNFVDSDKDTTVPEGSEEFLEGAVGRVHGEGQIAEGRTDGIC